MMDLLLWKFDEIIEFLRVTEKIVKKKCSCDMQFLLFVIIFCVSFHWFNIMLMLLDCSFF